MNDMTTSEQPTKPTRRMHVSDLEVMHVPHGVGFRNLESDERPADNISKMHKLQGQAYLIFYIFEIFRDTLNKGLTVLEITAKLNTAHGENYSITYIGDLLGEMKAEGYVLIVPGTTNKWMATDVSLQALNKALQEGKN